jgi:APA family basic amino acid/polyamine antiporter
MSQLLRKKTVVDVQKAIGTDSLKRALGPWTLTAMGVGAIIGTGIFVYTGEVARNVAGPALVVSYVLAGFICLLAALCYAEFAAMTPVAGSAYTYAYTTLGEVFAWVIGWDLVLEYAIGSATVANGWSSYFQKILAYFGVALDPALASAPLKYVNGEVIGTGSVINLPAVLIVGVLTAVLIRGIKESAVVNGLMVAVKVGAVLFVIVAGAFYVNPANWTPFAPYGWAGVSIFGRPELTLGDLSPDGKPLGMIAGSALIFFAYLGFDAVSTQAEEAKNPQRDVPIGIIGSLSVCSLLYVAVVAVLTGMVPYNQIDPKAGVATAFQQVGLPWADKLVTVAALAGITSVLLVMLLGAARVLMAVSRDGLLPPVLSRVLPTRRTPWVASSAVGLFTGLFAGLFPLDMLLEMTNIGTLFAFLTVCVAVIVLRRTNPDAPRPFRVPLVPLVPAVGAAGCLLLMLSLPPENWVRLIGWLVIGLGIYFGYGRWHSRLAAG